ncbi:MAG: DMT family transporter [Candidatus Latescibacteria bacterium]|nr:DMT family transporter [Candidatus Latescibacterota bacterium]
MRDQNKAYLYAFATVLLWSTVASAFKITLRYLDPLQLLLYASLASTSTLALTVIIQGKLRLALSYSKQQYLKSLLLGLLNPCLYYVILFKAYDLLPAQEAQPLNYTWAITLSLLSIPLLKQRIRLQEILAGFVCYAGVLVISTRGNVLDFRLSDPLGVTLALASTIVWALYWIYNARHNRDAVVGLFLNFTFAMPSIFILCLLFSDFRVSSLYGLMGAAYVGVVEMGIAFVFWLIALRLSETTARVANLIFISPFVSLFFIHFLVGEEILPSTPIGLVLIVVGLLIQRTGKRSK